MKADIEIYRHTYGWGIQTVGQSRMNDTLEEKMCILEQVMAIILGWADPLEFE
jgi:hypothetical protein